MSSSFNQVRLAGFRLVEAGLEPNPEIASKVSLCPRGPTKPLKTHVPSTGSRSPVGKQGRSFIIRFDHHAHALFRVMIIILFSRPEHGSKDVAATVLSSAAKVGNESPLHLP